MLHENPNIAKPVLSLGTLRKAAVEPNPFREKPGLDQGRKEEVRIDRAGNQVIGGSPTQPPSEPLPFVLIQGAIYPGEPSWTDSKGRAAALYHWRGKIVFEVCRKFQTKTERDAAEAFARSHRLSIANAFERRIVRADVVSELIRLYQIEIKVKPMTFFDPSQSGLKIDDPKFDTCPSANHVHP